jgi:hypothetical protein
VSRILSLALCLQARGTAADRTALKSPATASSALDAVYAANELNRIPWQAVPQLAPGRVFFFPSRSQDLPNQSLFFFISCNVEFTVQSKVRD